MANENSSVIITNKMKTAWTTGFNIPAGQSLNLNMGQYMYFQHNAAVFMKARQAGQIGITQAS